MTMRLRDQKRILMAKKANEKYNNDEDYRFLYEHISDIFARLLKSNLEFLNAGVASGTVFHMIESPLLL